MPRRIRKGIRIGPNRVRVLLAGARNRKKHLILFSIILDPASNQKVHLIQIKLLKRTDKDSRFFSLGFL